MDIEVAQNLQEIDMLIRSFVETQKPADVYAGLVVCLTGHVHSVIAGSPEPVSIAVKVVADSLGLVLVRLPEKGDVN